MPIGPKGTKMPAFLRFAVLGAGILSTIFAGSCNQSSTTQPISESRALITPKSAPPADVSSAQRFGMTSPAMQTQGSGMGEAKFTWNTPEGWAEAPLSSMRPINLKPAGDPKAECYLTQLGGAGGGLVDNVNRWRKQMGLDPVDETAVAALPKKPFLGGEATYVELEGHFSGMSGDQDNPDFKLAGLILMRGDSSIFVKMTGPKALIDKELPKFDQFCGSIQLSVDSHAGQIAGGTPVAAGGTELPAGHPPVGAAMQTAPSQGGSSLTWTVPSGWIQGAARPMREVTFTLGSDSKTECYIAKLSNRGGGVDANINRWAGQMGLEPLSADALNALPTIQVLGKPCKLVELKGTYTDMSGGTHPDSLMLGTIGEVGTDAYFIKMVGPIAEVEAHKANFVSFCESLKL